MTKIDRISGATTFGPDYGWRTPYGAKVAPHVADFLARFLSESKIPTPAPGQHIDINAIDHALTGEPIDVRMRVKGLLRAADLIDP